MKDGGWDRELKEKAGPPSVWFTALSTGDRTLVIGTAVIVAVILIVELEYYYT